MKIKRDIVTPYLGFVFLVVSITGVLMFFHLLDDYTNVVHEFLGLTFVLFAILHLVTNWKSFKNYSKKQMFIIQSVVVLVVSITLIIIGKVNGNLEHEILDKLLKTPVANSFKILNIDYYQAQAILRKNNIVVTDSSESMEEICIENQKSPEEIIELLLK